MEEQKEEKNTIPWMRDTVHIDLSESCQREFSPPLDPRLKIALHNMIKDSTSLLPVQEAVWHETIGPGSFERDLWINSPTGTGKTLSYVLPILQILSTRVVKCFRALVLLPTRDLAVQVKGVFDALAPAVGLSVGLAVGQSSIEDDISSPIKKLEQNSSISCDLEYSVDILVATPRRFKERVSKTGFTLEHLQYLVIDETDRLFKSYLSWSTTVLELVYFRNHNRCDSILPTLGSAKSIVTFGVERGFKGKPHPRLVKMVYSGAFVQDPVKIEQLGLHHMLHLTARKRRYQLLQQLKSFKVVSFDKELYLIALLESFKGEKCIVFTSCAESARQLCIFLNLFDDLQLKIEQYTCLQPESIRSKTLRAFQEGRTHVLISSDAIARGMDVVGVKNVINYDMPSFPKAYVRRAGRTARAGQVGICITLLHYNECKKFRSLLQKVGNEYCPEYDVPSIELFRAAYRPAHERFKEIMKSEERQTSQARKEERAAGAS